MGSMRAHQNARPESKHPGGSRQSATRKTKESSLLFFRLGESGWQLEVQRPNDGGLPGIENETPPHPRTTTPVTNNPTLDWTTRIRWFPTLDPVGNELNKNSPDLSPGGEVKGCPTQSILKCPGLPTSLPAPIKIPREG